MPREGYQSVALIGEAAEELRLAALDLSKVARRRISMSAALMVLSDLAADRPEEEVTEAVNRLGGW
jgi:ribosomal protein L18E